MQQHFIDNQWVSGTSSQTIDVIDPATGETFDTLQRGNAADIDQAVQSARRAYEGAWGQLTAAERGRLLMKLAYKLQDHAEELAQIESRDCGKPLKQACADAAAVVRYF